MERTLKIVEKTKLWFALSIIVIVIGLSMWAFKGLNFGIDFKGGSYVTVNLNKEVTNTELEDIRKIAAKYDPSALVQEIEGNQITIRGEISKLNNKNIPSLFKEIKDKYNLKDKDLLDSGTMEPSVGKELRHKAVISSICAAIGILLYVSFRFEYKAGLAAVMALVHDIFITISVYAIFQIPVNSPFIAALLTILGYSINDTIVVFDRIRENRKLGKYRDRTLLVNASITQTLARSINTVLTTLFTITAIYILGVPAVKEFAAPLIIGIVSGSYSSIFIASPLWVIFEGNKRTA